MEATSLAELQRLAVCPTTGKILVDHTFLPGKVDGPGYDKFIAGYSNVKRHPIAICLDEHHFSTFLKSPNASNSMLAAVLNFPLGRDPVRDVVKQAKFFVDNGVQELDLVIDYALIIRNKDCGYKAAFNLVESVREVCPRGQVTLKVIIEAGELKTSELIIAASMAALEGGCDFLKTSTGKVPVGATLENSRIMMNCIAAYQYVNPGCDVGFKAAGGVRTPEQALQFLQLAEDIMGKGWVDYRHFRFGSSGLLAHLDNALPMEKDSVKTENTAPSVAY